MNEFLTVLNAVIPVVLIGLSGFLMRRLAWLSEEADASLMRITINVLTPCLVFDAILGNRAFRQPSNVFLAPLVGFGTVALGLLVASLVRRWVPARTEATRRTFIFAVGVYNYGYVPLPLAWMLFDRETAAVLFVHNVGVEIALWLFGLMLLTGAGIRSSWRSFLTPPLLAIVATVALNAFIQPEWVPGAVRNATHLLGQCAIPLGIVLIGATMADHMHEFTRTQGGRVMVLACLVRLGVLPVLFLLLAQALPATVELKRVMLLQAAMPAAVFPIVMAKHYGGDPATALRVVLATSIAGLVTIPLWIRFGMHFLAR
jgi:predicted permease